MSNTNFSSLLSYFQKEKRALFKESFRGITSLRALMDRTVALLVPLRVYRCTMSEVHSQHLTKISISLHRWYLRNLLSPPGLRKNGSRDRKFLHYSVQFRNNMNNSQRINYFCSSSFISKQLRTSQQTSRRLGFPNYLAKSAAREKRTTIIPNRRQNEPRGEVFKTYKTPKRWKT